VGVEGEAGRVKGIDWDTRSLLGGVVDHFGLPRIPRCLALFHLLPYTRMPHSLSHLAPDQRHERPEGRLRGITARAWSCASPRPSYAR
jgi:hypothetical protein